MCVYSILRCLYIGYTVLPHPLKKGKDIMMVIMMNDFLPAFQKRHSLKFDGQSSPCRIHLRKIPALNADDEAKAFWESIKQRRGEA